MRRAYRAMQPPDVLGERTVQVELPPPRMAAAAARTRPAARASAPGRVAPGPSDLAFGVGAVKR